jgi:acyl carrier protein
MRLLDQIRYNRRTAEFAIVAEIVRSLLPEQDRSIRLKSTTKMNKLNLNSMGYIRLFFSLEDIIGKRIEDLYTDLSISSLKTIGELVGLVQRLRKGNY